MQIVEHGAFLAPDEQDIAETRGSDQGGTRAFAFQNGVCRDGRPMRDLGKGGRAPGCYCLQALEHGSGGVMWRAE